VSDPRWYRDLPWRRLWIAVGWALVAAIVVLSLISLPPVGPDIPQGDKYRHVLGYFLLTAWFAQITATRRILLAHALGFVVLGIVLEGLQSLNPERQVEGLDMLANALGVALGLAVGAGRARDLLQRMVATVCRSR
jgi:VanZ family protein